MLVEYFRSRGIVGHLYPIVSIGCHEHTMIGMMVEAGICLGCLIFRCEEAFPGDGSPRIGDAGNLESE